jgi:hypothetical protein
LEYQQVTSVYGWFQHPVVENYRQNNVEKSLEGMKKVLPLHPLSGTDASSRLENDKKDH